jgi:subtilisin family serine protease
LSFQLLSTLILASIDTGIDANHPAFVNQGAGRGIGTGKKILAGYDFVGNAYDPETNPKLEPSEAPTDCDGHGTHVAVCLLRNVALLFVLIMI